MFKLVVIASALSLSLFFALSGGARAGEILIVSADQPALSNVTLSQIQDAFLSKPAARSDIDLVAVDRSETSDKIRERFYEKVIGKSMIRMKAHWSQLIFTGRGNPPAVAQDLSELKKILSQKKHAVGFVGGTESTDGLRVLLRVSGD